MDFNKATATALSLIQQNKTLATTAAAVLAIGATLPLLSRIWADYSAWYALGPNGLPLNVFGYLFQALAGSTVARLDTRVPAPYDLAQVSRSPRYGTLSTRSFLPPALTPVPPRAGPRPEVPHFVGPQRQTSQRSHSAALAAQKAFMHALQGANPGLMRVAPSRLEGPLYDALWLADGAPRRSETEYMLHGEFVHPHGEGSTHMVLSLVDAAAAIEAGWAERHRMSGVRGLIPWGYVLVYAPRDEAEVHIWKEFVVASARYALGGDVKVVVP
ncbi:hypothetical protein GGR54DRAFT_388268 [Hypoxylon sp. NC1633]|nr:hypothetical protein GGR54DRAFT_388268 [Hypoxylon sp. NC1633]